ncbi:uncharacterized protein LOC124459811 [Drosophila willistoni]|uniref:uncharacterized protein LOC124459811 n=1 Tax=Drosophila willistoni TaxID=7260 RepID=UPI001F083061|nr:uncharacterized protein LOC124459811 [Drosophila willistoni]
MDFWSIFMFIVLTFLIMSCCGYCCSSKRRGTVLSNQETSKKSRNDYPATSYIPDLEAAGVDGGEIFLFDNTSTSDAAATYETCDVTNDCCDVTNDCCDVTNDCCDTSNDCCD